MQSDKFVPGYSPEEMDAIAAQHKDGRLMPFMELPLLGGQHIVRLHRKGDKYVLELGPEEATDLIRSSNPYAEPDRSLKATSSLNHFELNAPWGMSRAAMHYQANVELTKWLRRQMDLTEASVYDAGVQAKGTDHG